MVRSVPWRPTGPLLDPKMNTEGDDASTLGERSENAQFEQAVFQRIGHTGHQGLRRINVIVENHRIVLSGTVTSYYLKQMAQEAARQACPNLKVYNDLDVVPTQSQASCRK